MICNLLKNQLIMICYCKKFAALFDIPFGKYSKFDFRKKTRKSRRSAKFTKNCRFGILLLI